ncbi:copper resistance protein B [Sphingomonas sp. PWP1-2]|uniref:copper resistance protein B n=1 Tax=Sphingomonas sp. PWP1-2 TaxID=2804558 RepID=UPI003CE84970
MSRLLITLAAGTALGLTVPASASAQSMQGMDMPGMKMPMPAKKPPARKPTVKRPPAATPAARKRSARKPAAKPVAKHSAPAAVPAAGHAGHDAMPGMDHGSMPGMDMSGDKPAPAQDGMAGMPGMEGSAGQTARPMDSMPGMAMPGSATPGMPMYGMEMTGTALAAGNAPAPAAPMDHYSDRFFPPNEMGRSRSMMMREQGGQNFHQVMFNLAEVQFRNGRDGYRWDGEAWFGGDINRLTLKTEGEGVESAELQALYSRAVGPYFNLQAGVKHDFQPSPTRTYATIGFEGLAPYMFEVGGALFLSDKGELLGRLEGYYDQRITQRVILQPRVELNLAAQDVPETRTGSGLSNAELGLRLRYEITRQFAPYVGVSWDRKVGQTARYARLDGRDAGATNLVAGIRFWF